MSDGPRERFEAIFAEHFDSVLRFALARAQPEVAKDAVAETFTAAWRSLDDVPPAPRAWLLAVARRKLADHYRAAGRREALQARNQDGLQLCGVTEPGTQFVDSSHKSGVTKDNDGKTLAAISWSKVPASDTSPTAQTARNPVK